jgi:hypothetical protein
MTTANALDRGRGAFARRAWADAYSGLSAADHEAPLSPEDLERLATAAYLAGRDDDGAGISARAYHEWLHLGDALRAARCAFWLGFTLLHRGEFARGGGWLARAWRLLDDGHLDCVEQGIGRASRRAGTPICWCHEGRRSSTSCFRVCSATSWQGAHR